MHSFDTQWQSDCHCVVAIGTLSRALFFLGLALSLIMVTFEKKPASSSMLCLWKSHFVGFFLCAKQMLNLSSLPSLLDRVYLRTWAQESAVVLPPLSEKNKTPKTAKKCFQEVDLQTKN